MPGVIFDCDGVLVDSEPLAARAMSEVLAAEGLIITPNALMSFCIGLKQQDILAEVERRLGAPVPASVAAKLWPATQAVFAHSLRAMPGVETVLQAVGAPRAVASSSHPERIEFSLRTAGLAAYFGAHVYSSKMVARGKPAPDLFLLAAAGLAQREDACLVIEDSVAGTLGARAAGMRVLGFAGGGHATEATEARLMEAGAETVVTDWQAGLAALRRLMPEAFAAGPIEAAPTDV